MTRRRAVLRWGLGLGLLATSGALLRSLLWPPPFDDDEQARLLSFVATLLGDEPAAITLLPAFLAQGARDRALRRLVRRGLAALDGLADDAGGASFGALLPATRETVLEHAASLETKEVARIFYERLRLEFFGLYYSRPEVLAAMRLPPPPQPAGYPAYLEAR
jgi:hypothetical protein